MESLKHPFAPTRSLANWIWLVLYFVVDVAVILIAFVWLDDLVWEQFGELAISRGLIVGPAGFFGILLATLSGYLLLGSFPTQPRRVAQMLGGKVTSFIVLFVLAGNWQVALYVYALSEIASVSAGFGLVLLLHRFTDPLALWFLKQPPAQPSWTQKLIAYLFSIEMLPTLLFAVPLLGWAYVLGRYNYAIDQATSDYAWAVVLAVWLLAVVPLIIERYRYMNSYFTDWYKDFARRQGGTK